MAEPGQLGTIYHQILEKHFRGDANPRDLAQLQEALPAVAREVLDAAPRELGFRQTQWWERTREEIEVNTRHTLEELDQEKGQWLPVLFEAAFGRHGSPPLVIDGDPPLLLHGIIDRIDLLPGQDQERRLRIIDYKSGGAGTYTAPSVEKGKKLQLPLYALAARDALDWEQCGQPIEGFYWHLMPNAAAFPEQVPSPSSSATAQGAIARGQPPPLQRVGRAAGATVRPCRTGAAVLLRCNRHLLALRPAL